MGLALASSSSHEDISHPNLRNKLPSIPKTTNHIPANWPAPLAGMYNSSGKAQCDAPASHLFTCQRASD